MLRSGLLEWCGIEFRAIKEIIKKREHKKVMFIRLGDGDVRGVFGTDGFIDGRDYSASKLAEFIHERVVALL